MLLLHALLAGSASPITYPEPADEYPEPINMDSHDVTPDPPLTGEQLAVVEALSDEQIVEMDKALLANCRKRWRKVAGVVAFTMTDENMTRLEGVPDVYYAQRIRILVERGVLEYSGDLRYMRYSEVRLRLDSEDT